MAARLGREGGAKHLMDENGVFFNTKQVKCKKSAYL
jgi:hypothetical protein